MAKGPPIRLKAVIYSLSPFEQKVMPGLWKDLPHKVEKKITDNWLNAVFFLTPLIGTTMKSVDITIGATPVLEQEGRWLKASHCHDKTLPNGAMHTARETLQIT